MKSIFVLLSSLLFIVQGFSQTYIGKQKDIQQILANAAQFSEYVVNADYDNIVNSYTTDGKLFPNRLDILEGKEQIRQYWVLPEGVRTVAHKLTPVEIKITGKEAYDYGYFEGTTRRADGSESSWRGKYVVIWRKVDKDWKMYLDIWNGIDD